MYGFKIHMAGVNQTESYLARLNDKNVVRFKDIVVVGNGEFYSFAKVGRHIYAIIQTLGHHTAVLLGEDGFGLVPCSINDLGAYDVEDDFLDDSMINHAVSLDELDVDTMVKEDIVDSMVDAMEDMAAAINYRNPLIFTDEEIYRENFASAMNALHIYAHTFARAA